MTLVSYIVYAAPLVAALSWLLLAILILTVAPEAPLALHFFFSITFSAIAATGAIVAYVLDPYLPRPSSPRRVSTTTARS